MLKNTVKIQIQRTKQGLPALWESGGGYTQTGDAIVIAGPNGEKKAPYYIRQRGHLACDRHALLLIHEGDIIIEAEHHHKDFEIRVWRIVQIIGEEAWLNLMYEFSWGEWDTEPPEYLQPAIEAAMKKATCYHCREPHYIDWGL